MERSEGDGNLGMSGVGIRREWGGKGAGMGWEWGGNLPEEERGGRRDWVKR